MAKKTYNVKCERTQSNNNGSAVAFVIPGPDAPPRQPGQPPQRTAKTIVQFNFAGDNKAAKDFEVGKEYKITIE